MMTPRPKVKIRITAEQAAQRAEQVFGIPQPVPPQAATEPATGKPGLQVGSGGPEAAASGAGSSSPQRSTPEGQGC